MLAGELAYSMTILVLGNDRSGVDARTRFAGGALAARVM